MHAPDKEIHDCLFCAFGHVGAALFGLLLVVGLGVLAWARAKRRPPATTAPVPEPAPLRPIRTAPRREREPSHP
jgi:hypothetical protein